MLMKYQIFQKIFRSYISNFSVEVTITDSIASKSPRLLFERKRKTNWWVTNLEYLPVIKNKI